MHTATTLSTDENADTAIQTYYIENLQWLGWLK
jgi:hypothetical protein